MSAFASTLSQIYGAARPRTQRYPYLIKMIASSDQAVWSSDDVHRIPGLVHFMSKHSINEDGLWLRLLNRASSMSATWPINVISQICSEAAMMGFVDSNLCEMLIQRRHDLLECHSSTGAIVKILSLIGCSDAELITELQSAVHLHRESLSTDYLMHALRLLAKAGISDYTLALQLSEMVQAEKPVLSIKDTAHLIKAIAFNGIREPRMASRFLATRSECIRSSSPKDAALLLQALSHVPTGNIGFFLMALERLEAALAAPACKNGLSMATIALAAMGRARFVQFSTLSRICGHVTKMVESGNQCNFPALLESLAVLDIFMPGICTVERLAALESGRSALSLARGAWSVSAGYHTGSLMSYLPLVVRAVETNELTTYDSRWLLHSLLLDGMPALEQAIETADLPTLRVIHKIFTAEIPSDKKDGRYYSDSDVIDLISNVTGLTVEKESLLAGFEFYEISRPIRSSVVQEAVG